ncbi:MAG: isoprenyl transferase [Myxococcaceae bacterium]
MTDSTATREAKLKGQALPKHVGIIMDGNGRWAEAKGWPRIEGHREGSKSVREITRCARRLELSALTLYAFSSQNWARPPTEVTGLMELLREYLIKERNEILDNNIRLNAIGDLNRLPTQVREVLDELREVSAKNTKMVLTLALSYGGREELVKAAQALAAKAKAGQLDPSSISESAVEKELSTHDLPALDLIIRTSGERRISNFLLWQGAYAELYFTDTLWPDFRTPQLLEALEAYLGRERRFGLTGQQARRAAAE